MIIIGIGRSAGNVMVVQLPHANMIVDPRFFCGSWGIGCCEFSFSVNGTTLTITRIDEDGGWPAQIKIRAYMPTEDIPDFTSTVYTYWGLPPW